MNFRTFLNSALGALWFSAPPTSTWNLLHTRIARNLGRCMASCRFTTSPKQANHNIHGCHQELPNGKTNYCTASVETMPIHTRFEPKRGRDAERNGRETPSHARFWSVNRVGRLLLSWTSLSGFGKPQQACGWWSNALEFLQRKSQFQVKWEVPLVGPPVGCESGRFPDPHGECGGHVFLFPSSGVVRPTCT